MRVFLPVALAALLAVPLLGCDQDYAGSNENRESFMGDAHAFAPPVPASASAASAAPSATVSGQPPALTPTASVTAAPPPPSTPSASAAPAHAAAS
ncbi:MAG TPA: hypothetical protein VIY73_05185, partial [Polyangiaceae bacterium]